MIRIEHLNKTFNPGTINEKPALQDVNLELNRGDFVTVIGSNGAGKSTLMNCISGVIPVDSGTITLDGKDITSLPEYKRSRYIGRVFQDPLKGTAFDMTIEQNLAIAYAKDKPHGFQPGISRKE
ncbi:MAG: ATP-binding cassette domain-containing protein, partial [Firmicutes bacterium]|nr:ATP-binding cassette domain-containing protein [Bacillota bacterium]